LPTVPNPVPVPYNDAALYPKFNCPDRAQLPSHPEIIVPQATSLSQARVFASQHNGFGGNWMNFQGRPFDAQPCGILADLSNTPIQVINEFTGVVLMTVNDCDVSTGHNFYNQEFLDGIDLAEAQMARSSEPGRGDLRRF
jgi:hypothetical protein